MPVYKAEVSLFLASCFLCVANIVVFRISYSCLFSLQFYLIPIFFSLIFLFVYKYILFFVQSSYLDDAIYLISTKQWC